MSVHLLLWSLYCKVNLAAKYWFRVPLELLYKARNGSVVKVVKKETNAWHRKYIYIYIFFEVLKASKPLVILNNLRKYVWHICFLGSAGWVPVY